MNKSGKELWHVSAGYVDGAHSGDMDGSSTDELIAGMFAGGGLQAWSSQGKELWFVTLGNVWNQAVASATASQPARVFATEPDGTVRVFDARGNLKATLRRDE